MAARLLILRPVNRGSKILRALRWLHLYAGLVLIVPVVLLALSGCALVFKEQFWQWRHPSLADPPPVRDPAMHGAAIERIRADLETPIGLVKLPAPGVAAYQLWLADGSEALIDADSLQVIDRWHWWQRPTGWLAELHIHLLAGEPGRAMIGWIGLAVLGLLAIGAIVWWPQRRLFRWHSLVPRDTARPRMLMFHRNLGIVIMPLCFVLIAGGVGTAFFQPTRVVLNGLFGDTAGAPLTTKPQPARIELDSLTLPELLIRAQQALPDGRIVFVYPDLTDSGILTVRMKMPTEAHPNGLSFVHLDRTTGRDLRVVDASRARPGDRIANWMYPLHSGKLGGPGWQILVTLNGLILGTLAIAGGLAWWRTQRRRTARAFRTARRVR